MVRSGTPRAQARSIHGCIISRVPKRQRVKIASVRFGEVIRRLRLERGWTITMLAQQLGMSASYVGLMEKGSNMPSVEAVFELAAVFDVKAWQLLREFEDPTRPATPGDPS